MSIVVDVLVLTYKRTHLLPETLRSLLHQELPSEVDLRIVVVDNDPAQSAARIVRELRDELRARVHYVCEPVPNIAGARNRALSEARGDLAAFIDDDEVADPRWLAMLLAAWRRFDVAVVFGPVLPRLPAGAARWVERGGFFDRPRLPTGPTRTYWATNNVLIDLAVVRRAGVRFDTAYGRSGGEDTDFFHRLQQAGGTGAWCDEAIVWETVSTDRTNAGWLLRRAFTGGNNYARIFDRRRRLAPRLGRAFRHAAICVVFSLLAPGALLVGGPARAVKVGQISARNLGRLVGLLSARAIPRAPQ